MIKTEDEYEGLSEKDRQSETNFRLKLLMKNFLCEEFFSEINVTFTDSVSFSVGYLFCDNSCFSPQVGEHNYLGLTLTQG